jgi:putative transposase
MYDYRTLSPAQQAAVVAERQGRGFPWHGPPHPEQPGAFRLVTATCYEHRHLLRTYDRLRWFEEQLLITLHEVGSVCAAWCVLSNHYHVLVQVEDMRSCGRALGQLHGRTSYEMNRQDGQRGRKVWYRAQDRCMRSERHFYATLNYIHNNPFKHGYVSRWQAWPFSSFPWYLRTHGREWLLDLWTQYPVRNYGAAWDNFVLEGPFLLSLPPEAGS